MNHPTARNHGRETAGQRDRPRNGTKMNAAVAAIHVATPKAGCRMPAAFYATRFRGQLERLTRPQEPRSSTSSTEFDLAGNDTTIRPGCEAVRGRQIATPV